MTNTLIDEHHQLPFFGFNFQKFVTSPMEPKSEATTNASVIINFLLIVLSLSPPITLLLVISIGRDQFFKLKSHQIFALHSLEIFQAITIFTFADSGHIKHDKLQTLS